QVQDMQNSCAGDNDPNACFTNKCRPATSSAHGAWLQNMQALEAATRTYFAAYYKHATGLAANFKDPAEHGIASITAKQYGDTLYYGVLGAEVWHWTLDERSLEPFCVG